MLRNDVYFINNALRNTYAEDTCLSCKQRSCLYTDRFPPDTDCLALWEYTGHQQHKHIRGVRLGDKTKSWIEYGRVDRNRSCCPSRSENVVRITDIEGKTCSQTLKKCLAEQDPVFARKRRSSLKVLKSSGAGWRWDKRRVNIQAATIMHHKSLTTMHRNKNDDDKNDVLPLNPFPLAKCCLSFILTLDPKPETFLSVSFRSCNSAVHVILVIMTPSIALHGRCSQNYGDESVKQ